MQIHLRLAMLAYTKKNSLKKGLRLSAHPCMPFDPTYAPRLKIVHGFVSLVYSPVHILREIAWDAFQCLGGDYQKKKLVPAV